MFQKSETKLADKQVGNEALQKSNANKVLKSIIVSDLRDNFVLLEKNYKSAKVIENITDKNSLNIIKDKNKNENNKLSLEFNSGFNKIELKDNEFHPLLNEIQTVNRFIQTKEFISKDSTNNNDKQNDKTYFDYGLRRVNMPERLFHPISQTKLRLPEAFIEKKESLISNIKEQHKSQKAFEAENKNKSHNKFLLDFSLGLSQANLNDKQFHPKLTNVETIKTFIEKKAFAQAQSMPNKNRTKSPDNDRIYFDYGLSRVNLPESQFHPISEAKTQSPEAFIEKKASLSLSNQIQADKKAKLENEFNIKEKNKDFKINFELSKAQLNDKEFHPQLANVETIKNFIEKKDSIKADFVSTNDFTQEKNIKILFENGLRRINLPEAQFYPQASTSFEQPDLLIDKNLDFDNKPQELYKNFSSKNSKNNINEQPKKNVIPLRFELNRIELTDKEFHPQLANVQKIKSFIEKKQISQEKASVSNYNSLNQQNGRDILFQYGSRRINLPEAQFHPLVEHFEAPKSLIEKTQKVIQNKSLNNNSNSNSKTLNLNFELSKTELNEFQFHPLLNNPETVRSFRIKEQNYTSPTILDSHKPYIGTISFFNKIPSSIKTSSNFTVDESMSKNVIQSKTLKRIKLEDKSSNIYEDNFSSNYYPSNALNSPYLPFDFPSEVKTISRTDSEKPTNFNILNDKQNESIETQDFSKAKADNIQQYSSKTRLYAEKAFNKAPKHSIGKSDFEFKKEQLKEKEIIKIQAEARLADNPKPEPGNNRNTNNKLFDNVKQVFDFVFRKENLTANEFDLPETKVENMKKTNLRGNNNYKPTSTISIKPDRIFLNSDNNLKPTKILEKLCNSAINNNTNRINSIGNSTETSRSNRISNANNFNEKEKYKNKQKLKSEFSFDTAEQKKQGN